MITVISPAKRLDFDSQLPFPRHSRVAFPLQSEQLVERLRRLSPTALQKMMKISSRLAELNHLRFQTWARPTKKHGAKPAIYAFKGDVYMGLDVASMDDEDLTFAQEHLFILSGLHGVLRPLDLILPYRLEMSTQFDTGNGENLYEFWGNTITNFLDCKMRGDQKPTLINLASVEYFNSIRPSALDARIITPVFKEWKGGRFKVVSFSAKRARGLMSRYIVKKRINDPEFLKEFTENGYAYHSELSEEKVWTFART